MHLGVLAAQAGQSPVLVVGVEKMWTGHRAETIAGIEDGLPADERAELRVRLDNDAGSVLMALNATWVRHQIEERGTTPSRSPPPRPRPGAAGSRNPLAQFRTPVTVEEVLASPVVVAPLTRLMCSSFTDGAAAAVLSAGTAPGAPRVRASVLRSGNGELDYHDRLRETADEAWKAAGVGPERHRRRRAPRRHQRRGALRPRVARVLPRRRGRGGHRRPATPTWAGAASASTRAVASWPGAIPSGRPASARSPSSSPSCGAPPRAARCTSPRLAAAVNTGGIMSGKDTALVAVHVLERT